MIQCSGTFLSVIWESSKSLREMCILKKVCLNMKFFVCKSKLTFKFFFTYLEGGVTEEGDRDLPFVGLLP